MGTMSEETLRSEGTDAVVANQAAGDGTLSADRTDVIVIGAGPVGLFAAFYAGLRGLTVRIIDSLPELGGQLSALYPEKYIYDMPGLPRIKAKSLVRNLVKQAMDSEPVICLEEQAITLDRVTDDWIAVTTSKGVHITHTVVICGGVGSFTPRAHKAEGLDRLEGHGVHRFVKDPEDFRGKRVLVIGGGDSACDWALQVREVAEHVTLAHRRDVFQAHEETVNTVLASDIELSLFRDLVAVKGEDTVTGAVMRDVRTKEEEERAVDAVLLAIGFQASLGPIADWGLRLEKASIRVDSTMSTNRPGVFAAGDITTYPGKLKLIATGVGEAATAINHAKRFIDPAAKVFPGHSSDKDAPVAGVKIPTDE